MTSGADIHCGVSMDQVVAKELGSTGTLPPYVSIPGNNFAFGYGQSGYLEAAFNPFSVGGDPTSCRADSVNA